jgi:hypothetical protein
MANRDIKIAMADSGGTSLTGATKTDSFDTAWYSLNGLEYFGFVFDIGAVSGTSPTLNTDVEFTMDGGTTVFTEFPVATNLEAGAGVTTNIATLSEITTSDAQLTKYWLNPFPNDNDIKVRLECTVGGTGESFAIDNIYLVGRRFGKY